MNDDLDVISRLVDYHGHICAPSVPLAEDLRRGRRRVRRQRGVVAGGVVVAVASVVAVVSLVVGADSGERTQPTGPASSHSSPDGLGLTTPLVAPTSLTDVRERGFHVEPLSGFYPHGMGAAWAIDGEGQTQSLRWAEVADAVTVTVRYQGAPPPTDTYLDTYGWSHRENVTIHGRPGYYYEEPGGMYGIGGAFAALVAWEYAPDSWAYVSAHSDRMDPGPARLRAALVEVAEAIRPGGEPVRVPMRARAFPSSLPPVSRPTGVHLALGTPAVDFGPHLTLTVRASTGPMCVPSPDGGGVESFTYRGHSGCLSGYGATDQPPPGTSFNNLDAISLKIGDTIRTFTIVRNDYIDNGNAPEYPIADLKRALAGLTVAPLDDESTWFDLKAALAK